MKCSKCNADLAPGEMFCGECGHPVQIAPAPQPPASYVAQPAAPGSSTRVGLIIGIVAAGLILVMAVVGIGAWLWLRSSSPQEKPNPSPSPTASPSPTPTPQPTPTPNLSIIGTWDCEVKSTDLTLRGTAVLRDDPNPRTAVPLGSSAIMGSLTSQAGLGRIVGTFDGQKFSFKLSDASGDSSQLELTLSADGNTMSGEGSGLDGRGAVKWSIFCDRSKYGRPAN